MAKSERHRNVHNHKKKCDIIYYLFKIKYNIDQDGICNLFKAFDRRWINIEFYEFPQT